MEAPPPIPPSREKKSLAWLWLFLGITTVAMLALWAAAPKLFKMSGLTLTQTTEVWTTDGTGTKTTVQIAGEADRERLIAEGQTALDTGNI